MRSPQIYLNEFLIRETSKSGWQLVFPFQSVFYHFGSSARRERIYIVELYRFVEFHKHFVILGIFISFLHPNGAAEATGRILEGDQILSVNNLSFINMNHQDVVDN